MAEYLARPDGTLQRVISVPGTGYPELVAYDRWQRLEFARTARRCACGAPCGSGTSRTCGSAECIARLPA
jgi:hypothetical protein